MSYWKRKAALWVSLSVLVGGLVSAGILFWLTKLENEFKITSIY